MLKGAALEVFEMYDIRRCWRASSADCTFPPHILDMDLLLSALSACALFAADNPYILGTSDTFVSFASSVMMLVAVEGTLEFRDWAWRLA